MKTNEIKQHLKDKHDEFISSLYDFKMKELIKYKTYFAGGAIRDLQRGLNPKDYDLFFVDEESLNEFKDTVKLEFSLKKTKIGNYNSKQNTVQVVTVVSGSPDNVVDKFDFTINKGYYLPQMNLLFRGDDSNELTACREVLSPLNALLRVEKFRKMGYNCPIQTLVDLGVAISKMKPLGTEEKIMKALMGMSFSEMLEGTPQSRKKRTKLDRDWNGNPLDYSDIPF